LVLVGGDDIEQVPLRQSTERHHSIIDWLSRESSGVVRSIQYHPQDILQSSPTTPSRIQRSILTLVLVGGDDIEQGPQHQSTEWHHSIIDWLSRESSVLVRQDISPIITNTKQNITIDTHIRYLLVMMMILNRDLDHNQLSGTIPSSIGSFLNLHYLYVNPIPSTDILQSSPTTSTIYHDTHNDTC